MAIRESASDFTAVIAALQAQVDLLQAQNIKQEQQLDGLRSQFSTAERRRQASRLRAALPLLSLLGILALSVLFLPTTRAQTPDLPSAKTAVQPNPDQADVTAATTAEEKIASPNTTGQPMLIGQGNAPTVRGDNTLLYNPSTTDLMPLTFQVINYSNLDISATMLAGRSIAILGSTSGTATQNTTHVGVMGVSDNGQRVYGWTNSVSAPAIFGESKGTNGTGVYGEALGSLDGWGIYGVGGVYGGVFKGSRAPIQLFPSFTNGAPTTGSHGVGELYVSADGHLFFCRAAGTPGTWVRLDLAANFVPLIQKN